MARLRLLIQRLRATYQNFLEDGGAEQAAAIAYYMALSFFPLLIVGISVGGFALRLTGWGQDARAELLKVVSTQMAPQMATQIDSVLQSMETHAARNGPLGLVMLLLAAMAVFSQFDKAFDRIWNTSAEKKSGLMATLRNVLWDRLRAFLLLLGLGVFLLAGFVATMSVSTMLKLFREWLPFPSLLGEIVTAGAAVLLNTVLFASIYKTLPKPNVSWREASGGALLASLLWEVGRRLLASLVIGSKYNVYGVVGAFIAVMLWVYYAVTVIFVGAEFVQASMKKPKAPPPA